jgi:hypothetical protein
MATLQLEAQPGREAVVANEVVGATEVDRGAAVRQRGTTGGSLPLTAALRAKRGTAPLVVEGSQEMPSDPTQFADVTLRRLFQSRALPPGAYGKLTLHYARVVLGKAGSVRPERYDFESLELREGAEIDLVGPVVITVGQVAKLSGRIGRPDLPQWLDLRIAGGAVDVVEGAAIHGAVYAPRSEVRLKAKGEVRGWVGGERVVIEAGGRVAAAPRPPGPVLRTPPQAALLVQERLAATSGVGRAAVETELSFVDDAPVVVVGGRVRSSGEKAQAEERRAWFEAARAALFDTGFTSARLSLAGGSTLVSSKAGVAIVLTVEDFLGHLVALGGTSDPGENVRRIGEIPLLQTLFFERSVAVATAKKLNLR